MKGRDILQKLNKDLLADTFSHIYIENAARDHENTKRILEKLEGKEIVYINHYKDVFSRSNQNFVIQKQSPKLILAVKKDNLIYKGAEVCDDFGNENFYYTSTMMNCLYDCEYCYLQGMYTSANIVVFVNIDDIFKEVEKLLKLHSVYLCISYDTDMLALEHITNYTKLWIEFCRKHQNLKIELRTKSSNFNAIKEIAPLDNFILAWTLSPEGIIHKYENKTPNLELRLSSIKAALDKGWNVRLCFDPMLYIEGWEEKYASLVKKIFCSISGNDILDVSIGTFRVSKDYIKRMRKQRHDSIILNYPFETIETVSSYPAYLSDKMVKFLYGKVSGYVSKDKIYVRGE